MDTRAEVHLVRRLAPKRGVRKPAVVFRNVESHKATKGADGIELIQEKPLVLERSPPRFDHGIRARNLDLRKYATESTGLDKLVDGLGSILHAAIGEKGRWTVARVDTASSLEEDLESVRRIESLRHSPPENPSREVVDHGVDIRMASVEESNHGGVDVPDLIGRRRTDSKSWLRGMDALARTSPAIPPDESVPRRGRGEDLPEPRASMASVPVGTCR